MRMITEMDGHLDLVKKLRRGGEERIHSTTQADLDLLIRMGYLNAKVG